MTTQSLTTAFILQAWQQQIVSFFTPRPKATSFDLSELTNAQRKDVNLPLVQTQRLPRVLTEQLW